MKQRAFSLFTVPGCSHLVFRLKPLPVFSCRPVSSASECAAIASFLALSSASPIFLSQTAAQPRSQPSESLALQSCSVLFTLRESQLIPLLLKPRLSACMFWMVFLLLQPPNSEGVQVFLTAVFHARWQQLHFWRSLAPLL